MLACKAMILISERDLRRCNSSVYFHITVHGSLCVFVFESEVGGKEKPRPEWMFKNVT